MRRDEGKEDEVRSEEIIAYAYLAWPPSYNAA